MGGTLAEVPEPAALGVTTLEERRIGRTAPSATLPEGRAPKVSVGEDHRAAGPVG